MVKRPKSPEIVEDARFFTVYQPYPLNPDWHEENDQIEAAKWVAECIGPNHLWAIHEKPRAGNMILLEVSKDFVDHGLLLGEHRWAEFLKSPTAEEKLRVTQVFHSFYARGRDAQKDGWKVIPVNSRWLYKWVPGKGKIIHPYPETHWCTPPVEDRTNKTLCRPLPSRSLPVERLEPPSRPPAPVVGSSTWVAKQTEPSPTIKPSALDAWAKPTAGTLDIKKASQFIERDRSTPSPMSPPSGVSAGRAEFPSLSTPNLTPLNGKNAWGKPVPLQKFVADAAKANVAKGKSSWAPTPASPSGAKSPLTEQPPKGPVNAWSNPLKVPPALRAKPSTPSTPSTRSQSPWSALETTKESWITQDAYEKDENKVKNSSAPGSDTHSPSPRKGRSGDLPHEQEREISRHKSSSRTRTHHEKSKENKYDTVDFVTPQRDKQPAWGVPSPEPADKKARDKGKKKAKDTSTGRGPEPENNDRSEKVDFEVADEVADSSANKDKGKKKENVKGMAVAAPFDWASEPLDDPGYDEEVLQLDARPLQTPNAQSMDIDTQANHGERSLVPTNKKERSPPRQPKSWGKTGRPESPYEGKKFDGGSPRDGEFNSRDGSRSWRPPGSPIKVKDLPSGRSDGQWDHSGFAEMQHKKKNFDKPREKFDTSKDKFDKPRDRFDKPKDKYDKPRGRYNDRPRDKYDDKKDSFEKPRDNFDKPRDRVNKGKGKFDKPSDKMQLASSSKDSRTFDWSTLEGQDHDWARSPPETGMKDKGKKKADENLESPDFGYNKNAIMEIDDDVMTDWGELSFPPSDTKGTGNPGPSRNTFKNTSTNPDAPEPEPDWGEWGPPPPSPKKGSSSAMDVDTPETDWGEWGPPPPPAHLKKNLQSKVFRTDDEPPKPAPKKGKKFDSDKPKASYKDSTRDSGKHTKDSAANSKATNTAWGEWGPPPESKKSSASKVLKSETPKVTPKSAAMEIDVPETGWGEWGPPPSSSKKEPTNEPKVVASGVDDYNDWGHAPHKTKLASKKTERKKPGWDSAGADALEDRDGKFNDGGNVGKLEDWLLPSASESAKDSTTTTGAKNDDTSDWGAWSTSAPTESKKSPKKSDDDIGFKAEDWGIAPVSEESGKDDFGTRAEDWGLGPVPLGPGDDVDESEYHPWEKTPSTAQSAWGPTWKRDTNSRPTRPRGSKRGPRTRKKKEPPSIGRLRGFQDVDQEEFGEEGHLAEVNESETSALGTAGAGEDWQAPIGGNLEDWGAQQPMDAWA